MKTEVMNKAHRGLKETVEAAALASISADDLVHVGDFVRELIRYTEG